MKPFLVLVLCLFCSLGYGQAKKVSMVENARKANIFPNPARSFVHIQFKQAAPAPASLVVYNFLGKKQLETLQPGTHVYLDLTSFNRGIYIFQFRDRNGVVIDSGKFQVEK